MSAVAVPGRRGRRQQSTLTRGVTVGRSVLWVGLCALLACGDPLREATTDPEVGPASPSTASGPAHVYERSFTFLAEVADTLLIVPWLMTAEESVSPDADSVHRETRGWVARGGTWESFYEQSWSTPSIGTVSRILPHGNLAVTVRDGDIVDGLVFEEGARNLEIQMSDVVSAWVAPGGESFEVMTGALYLSDERIEGIVLEGARSWTSGSAAPGDWGFLASGDSVYVVFTSGREHNPESEPVYRGWARRGASDLAWSELRVSWSDRQAFPPSRRDVPTAWTIEAPAGEVRGSLNSVSSQFTAGDGAGPLLPVLGLIEVGGVITLDGDPFPVRGLWIHRRR